MASHFYAEMLFGTNNEAVSQSSACMIILADDCSLQNTDNAHYIMIIISCNYSEQQHEYSSAYSLILGPFILKCNWPVI
jgi:hypothetical protein